MKGSVHLDQKRGVTWAHPSITALMAHASPHETPDELIRRRCRELVTSAKDLGWTGPPYDPELLASLNDITVEFLTDNIRADARIFPGAGGRLIIQCSASVSPERQRFSICHEITHTRFPDCYEEVRYRQGAAKLDWKHKELERLCNVGAAELLIPHEDFRERIIGRPLSLELANTLRQEFACSMEAMLYRLIDFAEAPCAVVFLSKRLKPQEERSVHPEFDLGFAKPEPKYRIDYMRASARFGGYFPPNKSIPMSSIVYTVRPDSFPSAVEDWEIGGLGPATVEASVLPMIAAKQQERVAALVML